MERIPWKSEETEKLEPQKLSNTIDQEGSPTRQFHKAYNRFELQKHPSPYIFILHTYESSFFWSFVGNSDHIYTFVV